MARVDDSEAWRRLVSSLAQWSRMIDGSSAGMRTVERDGYIATITPATPDRSLVNDVVYWDPAALGQQVGGIAIGVRDPDRPGTDADPEAMIVELGEIQRPPEPPGFSRDVDPLTVVRINDAAYGLPDSFQIALADMELRDGLYVYGAGEDGRVSSCLFAFDHEDDCSVWLVATLPHARGRGLAAALMAHALADAAERGRTTSTLQATDLGRPVYERLGYRSLGEIELWESRGNP